MFGLPKNLPSLKGYLQDKAKKMGLSKKKKK